MIISLFSTSRKWRFPSRLKIQEIDKLGGPYHAMTVKKPAFEGSIVNHIRSKDLVERPSQSLKLILFLIYNAASPPALQVKFAEPRYS